MLWISPANATTCQQGWHLLVKTSVASPKERREELRERAWLEDEMRRETIVQDWKKASDQRWGETVRFLSDICVFQLQKSNVHAGAQSTPRFQSGGPSQRPKIFLLEDWPQLQTSEAGKSPLKAAIGPEEWSKFTNYKTYTRRTAQLSSPKPAWTSETWPWKSPFDQEEYWYQWGDGGPTTQLRDPMIPEIVLE